MIFFLSCTPGIATKTVTFLAKADKTFQHCCGSFIMNKRANHKRLRSDVSQLHKRKMSGDMTGKETEELPRVVFVTTLLLSQTQV